MFRKLLVPLDGSPLAEEALGRAAAIARATGAELELVLVHHPFPSEAFEDAPWNAEEWTVERDYLDSMADEVAAGASVAVKRTILKGDPIESLCLHATEANADLIVMTSHGRTGLSRAWLGSVADGVIRRSSVPVLMLRAAEGKRERFAAHKLFSRVLVTLDGSSYSAEVIPAVEALATCCHAGVWVLRAVRPVPVLSPEAGIPFTYTPMYVNDEATQGLVRDAEAYVAEVARRIREETSVEVEANVIVAHNVAPAILDYARAHQIDLIAMATHGRGASRLLVGSVADKVLRGSDVPLLVYRPLEVVARSARGGRATNGRAPLLTSDAS